MWIPSLLLTALPCTSELERLLAAVPAKALAVAATPGLDALAERGKENDWWKLLQDEALQPLYRRVGELLTEGMREGFEADEVDERVREVLTSNVWLEALRGPMVAFFANDEAASEGAGFGVFVVPGRGAERFEELVAAMEELPSDWDGTESIQEYQGVELQVFERAADADHRSEVEAEGAQEDQDSGPPVRIEFELDGVFALFGGDERAVVLELAQASIDSLLEKDDSPGFAGSAALAEARVGGPETRDFELFFDVSGFVRRGLEAAAPDADEEKRLRAFMGVFGVDTMRYAHLAAGIGAGERLDLSFSVHVTPRSLLQRALALLRPAGRELLRLAPADARNASVFAVDLAGAWRLLQSELAELQPEARATLDAGVAAFEAAASLRLEQDLLAQFTGEFGGVAVSVPSEELMLPPELLAGAEALAQGEVYLFGLEDGQALSEIVARLLALGGMNAQVEQEEYQGHTIHRLGLGSAVGPHWAFTDELLAFSLMPTPLRTVLARVGKDDLPAMISDPRYAPILAQHAGAAGLALSDARSAAETMFSALGFVADMVDGFAGSATAGSGVDGIPEEVLELFELVPEPDFVSKYIDGVLFSTLEVQPERLRMRVGCR